MSKKIVYKFKAIIDGIGVAYVPEFLDEQESLRYIKNNADEKINDLPILDYEILNIDISEK